MAQHVSLEAVRMSRADMRAISQQSEEWRHRPQTKDTSERWIDLNTGAIVTASTPEGIPDDYVYVAPDEEVPDGYDVVESSRGGTYRSPQPVDGAEEDTEEPVPDIEDATNSAEVGAALGFDMAAHEVLEEGDTIIVDTEGIPEGYGLPDEAEGYIRFIDSDWVEISADDVIQTFPIEQIRSAEVPANRGRAGIDKFEMTPNASQSDLAGGVAAAISDDRDDFHDIRNAVTGADTPGEAREILAEELSNDELDDLIEEVQIQEDMRERYGVIDDAGNLGIGQKVLYDADRPKRGTVDDIDADGTVWVYQPARDLRSGVNPDFGTMYADPDYEGAAEGTFTAERGRYGLASNSEVLQNAFAAANTVTGSREAGIKGGNTTGDKMKILDMPDGSRVFATPADAYPGTTGVVSSQDEAITNNTNSPRLIEALGGKASQTEILRGPDDRKYIAKEGIPGQTLSEFRDERRDPPEGLQESRRDTMAAAYFTGNRDLHGGNLMISDEGEMVVIDHDSAGFEQNAITGRRIADISRYNQAYGNVDERIYDLAQEVRSGERDLGVPDYSDHAEYAKAAADKAVRQAYLDPSYDLPEDQVPAELQFGPPGVYELDDLRDPNDVPEESYRVEYVADNAQTVEGELVDIDDGNIVIDRRGIVDVFTDLNRLTEVYD